MGDPLKHVQAGDPLPRSAETFNCMIDAARFFREHSARLSAGMAGGISPGATYRQSGIVLVKNGSGYDRDRFDVLGIGTPIISPTDNLKEFQTRVALTGITPAEASHAARFVILLEPIANGRIGRACASGICVAKVDVSNEDHAYAAVKDSDCGSLISADSGPAVILWKESGTGDGKWAIVHLGTPVLDSRDRWAEAIQNWSAASGGNLYGMCRVKCKPVVDGVRDDEADDLCVYLWTPYDGDNRAIQHPNVVEGQRILYRVAVDGNAYCTIPYLDHRIGDVFPFDGDPNALPAGWALCDGTDSRPDTQERVIVGWKSGHADYDPRKSTGGADCHCHPAHPAHCHSLPTCTGGPGTGYYVLYAKNTGVDTSATADHRDHHQSDHRMKWTSLPYKVRLDNKVDYETGS